MEKTNSKIGWKQLNMMISSGRGIGMRQLLAIHCAGFANIWRGCVGYEGQN
jgi:hypothetical protein